MPETFETLRLEQRLLRDLDLILDQQTRDLVQAWALAWDEIVLDLRAVLLDMLVAGDRISRRQMQRSQRLRKALDLIADQLQGLAAQSGVRISGDIAGVVATAGAAQASIIDSQLPPGASQLVGLDAWSQVDPLQVAAIIARSTERITADTRPLAPRALAAVRRELVRGVLVGSNPRNTARRILDRVEHAFNGGLTRALVISRTETLDAHRSAAATGQAQHEDVLAGWVWTASLSPRTCRACISMHGRLFPLEEPGPYGHQQCRCTRRPKPKPWRDLGFDVDEPEDISPDADEFFDGLSAAEQADILGDEGYRAWLAGEFPREEWARRRESPGWRDSYVPAVPGGPNAAGHGQQPPKPPRPAGPGGPTPPDPDTISGKLVILDGSIRDLVTRNAGLIDAVHRIDPGMATIDAKSISPAFARFRPGVLGFYKHDSVVGPELQVLEGSDQTDLTVVHELGHALDDLLFGTGRSETELGTIVDPATFAAWRQAVESTESYRTLLRLLVWDPAVDGHWSTVITPDGREATWDPDPQYVRYLLRWPEMFARAYAQWIASRGVTRSEARAAAARVLEQIRETLPSVPAGHVLLAGAVTFYPSHWDDADFADIALTLDALFGDRGLLTEET